MKISKLFEIYIYEKLSIDITQKKKHNMSLLKLAEFIKYQNLIVIDIINYNYAISNNCTGIIL